MRPPRAEVAAEEICVDVSGLRVCEDCLERREAAVDVVEEGKHRG
jgi:hypothetical protein